MSPAETHGGILPDYYLDEVKSVRKPEHFVHPLILNRWSPRSYKPLPVSEANVHIVLEAARWAPSSSNQQPWRFYVARTPEEHEVFQSFISPGNRLWTDHAPVLILIASETRKDNGEPNAAHAFDAGAAWGILSLQASLLGLSTRAVGGFDKAKAREALKVPETVALHAVIALGYRGHPDRLPESLREREKPTDRRPLGESILPIPTAGR
jgi:nitroreductase